MVWDLLENLLDRFCEFVPGIENVRPNIADKHQTDGYFPIPWTNLIFGKNSASDPTSPSLLQFFFFKLSPQK